ncbi:hypothetical protein CFP56_034109 [Quercus suber]|uniref:Uncharacterized protein n=1 Tax=Quercus suber TaxID=58331 RepID=A0AAW0LQF0_QUESU
MSSTNNAMSFSGNSRLRKKNKGWWEVPSEELNFQELQQMNESLKVGYPLLLLLPFLLIFLPKEPSLLPLMPLDDCFDLWFSGVNTGGVGCGGAEEPHLYTMKPTVTVAASSGFKWRLGIAYDIIQVALLLQIGKEAILPDIVPMILASRDCKELAKYALFAPPHGLCLLRGLADAPRGASTRNESTRGMSAFKAGTRISSERRSKQRRLEARRTVRCASTEPAKPCNPTTTHTLSRTLDRNTTKRTPQRQTARPAVHEEASSGAESASLGVENNTTKPRACKDGSSSRTGPMVAVGLASHNNW